ncbi:MAG: hypothetical protein ACREXW_10775 [Gammaproteobacteria bacterium]
MPTRSDVRLCIKTATELKGLLWVSFLPEECISIGFPDKTFVVPMLNSRSEGVEAARSQILDLAEIHGKQSVKNPHFTLHPPGHFHLKSENRTVLCEALVWTEPEPGHEVSPWLRFTSNPIATLPSFRRPAHGRKVQIYTLIAPKEDSSAAVHIDFVREPGPTHVGEQKVAHYFTWGQAVLRVLSFCVPSQPASLGYEITR